MKALTIGVCAAGAVVLAAQAQAQGIVWDMANEYPATSVQGEGDQHFSRLLSEKSGGEIEIVHHFGGALGYRSRDQLDAVADGAIIIANTFIPPLSGIDPIFLLSSLPFVVADSAEAHLLYEVAKPYYEEVYEQHNQKLLYASPWPQSGLWGRKAVLSMDELTGFKFRTYDANGTRVFQAAGASPLQLSWADIVPQLSTGGIDGVLTSIESGISASFNDYLKHFIELNYDSTINMVTMNLDAWNGLSGELQTAVLEAAAETEEFLWSNITQVVERRYATARERGVEVVTDVPEDFRNALREVSEPTIQAWVDQIGEQGAELLRQYRERSANAN